MAKSDPGASSSDLFFIKLCFTSPSSAQKGVALVRINAATKSVEKIETVASQSSNYLESISTMAPISQFVEFIKEKRFRMDFNQKSTMEVANCLKEATQGNNPMEAANTVSDLVNFGRKNDVANLVHQVYPFLSRSLYDKKLEMDLGIEFTSQQDLDQAVTSKKMEAENPQAELKLPTEPQDEFFSIGEDKVLLDCHPVLSPVTGVPVSSLKPGLEVMVRIDNNSVVGNKYNSMLNLVGEDGKIMPTKAVVESYKPSPEGHKILLNINGNVYGKIVETEGVKIKLFEATEVKDAKPKASIAGRLITVGLIVGLILLIALLYFVFI